MKRYRKRKLRIVNLRRFLASVTVIGLVMAAAIIPVKNYVFKNVFGKNTVSAKSNDNMDKSKDESIKSVEDANYEKQNQKNLNIDKVDEEKEKNKDNNSEVNNNVEVKPVDNKEFFKNSVFMGDSITEALSFYEFLDESQVIALKGHTLIDAKNDVDKVAEVCPEKIFMLFGMNDLEMGINGEEFAKNYSELIDKLKEKLPNSNIYINSILPISEEVQKKEPLLAINRIDEFNNAVIKMAKDKNVNYINIAPLLEENKDLYEPDGKHTKYHFYELWLDYIKNNVK